MSTLTFDAFNHSCLTRCSPHNSTSNADSPARAHSKLIDRHAIKNHIHREMMGIHRWLWSSLVCRRRLLISSELVAAAYTNTITLFDIAQLLTCRWKNPYELKSQAIHSGIGSGKDDPVRRMVMPTTFMVVVFVGDVGSGGLGFVVVVGGGRGDRIDRRSTLYVGVL